MLSDLELYGRGVATVLASWDEYARAAPDAEVLRLPSVAAAVFPTGPEHGVYNNAIIDRDLDPPVRAAALEATEAAYAERGVARFAAWVHESDKPLRADVERRGYALDTWTAAMGTELDGLPLPRPDLDLATIDWGTYLRLFGLPAGLLEGADLSRLHILCARLDGEVVATAAAFDHCGDCGIYNVGTVEHARRRGLGTALTALQLHEARARGCVTASVQATEMACGVYATAGFRDLGRFLEYVPAPDASAAAATNARPARELKGTQVLVQEHDREERSEQRCASNSSTDR